MQEYLSIFLRLYEDRRRQKHRSRFLVTKKDIHTQRARRRLTEEKKKNENTSYLRVRRCDHESHVYAISSRIEHLFASLLLKSVSIIPILCRCSMHVICSSRNAFN